MKRLSSANLGKALRNLIVPWARPRAQFFQVPSPGPPEAEIRVGRPKIGQRVTIRATIVEAFCGRFDLDMKPVFVASAARGRDQWHRIVIRGGSVVGLPLAVPPVIFCPNRTVHHNSMVQLPVYGVVVSIFMLLVSSIQMPA